MEDSRRWMQRALALARRGGRAASPNPLVGCVIVKSGKAVAQAWHARDGGPHAESVALARAGTRACGATAYVTLEPCTAHRGKRTPPCAQALADSGLARVVCAIKDPNPGVSGRGLRFLRRRGIKVTTGVMAQEAAQMNKAFITRMTKRRPYIILKSALSLDGKAFARGGASRWITSPASRRFVHRLRARADAVLVGIGTVLADDPALTSHGSGPDPLVVILDSRLRLPRSAALLRAKKKPLVFTRTKKTLKAADVVTVGATAGRLNLKQVLTELARRRVGTLLVEGGPTVSASFLEAGLADELYAFFAPKLLAGARDPNRAPRVAAAEFRRIGQDFLFYGRIRP